MNELIEPIGICIHHSLWKDTVKRQFGLVKKDHIEYRHWDDIGYHEFHENVNGKIRIFTGRPLQFEGAHARGYNDYIGICAHGNYDKELPPREMISSLVNSVVSYWIKYPALRGKLTYHNEIASKSCPGLLFPDKKRFLSWCWARLGVYG